jgi:hypothetical protein
MADCLLCFPHFALVACFPLRVVSLYAFGSNPLFFDLFVFGFVEGSVSLGFGVRSSEFGIRNSEKLVWGLEFGGQLAFNATAGFCWYDVVLY